MRSCLFIACILLHISLRAQICINEVCSKNANVIKDEFNKDPDWIELFNNTSSTVNLSGYKLTDHSTVPGKFIFPDTILNPGAFILVFASGTTSGPSYFHAAFKLSVGEKVSLISPAGTVVDSILINELYADHSLGRYPDGTSGTFVFKDPTPGDPNISTPFTGYCSAPVFNKRAGFYNETPELEIDYNTSESLYYTVNGAIPTTNDYLYNGEIEIDSTTVISARTFRNGYLPSKISTATYFINEENTLPVISICTDPDRMYQADSGICVLGPNANPAYPHYGANFWQKKEIPIRLQMYDLSGKITIDQDAGLMVHGGTVNRNQAMKSFRLLAKAKYGKSKFQEQLISGKKIYEYKKFVLRNSSSDFNKTQFRDGILHKILLENTHVDALGYEPVKVYVNGRYYGLMDIREKIDDNYVHYNHGAEAHNIDMIIENGIVKYGDTSAFMQTYRFVCMNDMTKEDNFSRAKDMIDLENMCDYFICETYLNNNDWPNNNLRLWRERSDTGKWRYIVFDLDASLNGLPWSPVTLDIIGNIFTNFSESCMHVKMLLKLLENNDFRNYFVNRYADLMNTTFVPDSMKTQIARIQDKLKPEMPVHKQKWGGTINDWYNEINNQVIPFIEQRPALARDYLKKAMALDSTADMEFNVYPATSGTIHLNTLQLNDLPWSGKYYKDIPISLTAIATRGYVFSHWLLDNNYKTPIGVNNTTIFPANAKNITAVFVKAEETTNTLLYPNPANEDGVLKFYAEQIAAYQISVINAEGEIIRQISGEAVNGINLSGISSLNLSAGIYLVKLNYANKQEILKWVIAPERK